YLLSPSATSNTSSVRSPHFCWALPFSWVHLPAMMSLFMRCTSSLRGGRPASQIGRYRTVKGSTVKAACSGAVAFLAVVAVLGGVLDGVAGRLDVPADALDRMTGGQQAHRQHRDEDRRREVL